MKSSKPWKLAFRSSLCCTMHRGQPLARSITASKLWHAMTCSSICLKMPMETRKKTCFCCSVSWHGATEFCELKKKTAIKTTGFPTELNFQQSKVSSNDKPHRQFSNMRSSETSLSAFLFCHQLPFIDQ